MSFGDTFKALSDPTRREILSLLKQGSTVFQEVLSWIQTLMEADNHEEDK